MTENNQEVFFPKQDDFEFLLIKSTDISNIRFDNPEYKKIICSLDNVYETIKTSSDNFFNNIAKYLEVDKFKNPFGLNTQLIGTTKEYIYELIHIDLHLNDQPVEIYNGVANILKNDHQLIFGNSIMIKTLIPVDKDYITMINCSKNDLHELLENRVRHLGVSVDDDGELNEINWYYEDPSKMIDDFMMNEFIFVEKAFLLHNLQIYYTKGTKNDMKKLIDDEYDQMIVLTKLTDYYYGNFDLVEFNNIINLLKTECPLSCPEDWKEPTKELREKLESEKRKFIFNKEKALDKAIKLFN